MILGRIFTPALESRLLPAKKFHRPTVAVVAIMTFAMVIAAAAALALASAAGGVASGAENRFVIVIPAAVAQQLPDAVAAARSVDGVQSVTAIPEPDMRRTLRRWLGDAASSSDLPVPALATAELAPGADAAAVAKAVRAKVPQAKVSSETSELAPMLDALRLLQWLALATLLLIGGATAAAVVLAARGALDTHRSTVEIMHGIGATDEQLTQLFVRMIAFDSIAGAAAGALAAAGLLLIVGGSIAAASSDFAAGAPLDAWDFAALLSVPVAAVLIAIAVARRTLLRALRETL